MLGLSDVVLPSRIVAFVMFVRLGFVPVIGGWPVGMIATAIALAPASVLLEMAMVNMHAFSVAGAKAGPVAAVLASAMVGLDAWVYVHASAAFVLGLADVAVLRAIVLSFNRIARLGLVSVIGVMLMDLHVLNLVSLTPREAAVIDAIANWTDEAIWVGNLMAAVLEPVRPLMEIASLLEKASALLRMWLLEPGWLQSMIWLSRMGVD